MAIRRNADIRNWHIYKISSPSGRNYVGLTSNIKLREKNYRKLECKNQTLLFNSLVKYGWDSHKFEIIDQFTSNVSYAYGKEMFWIRSYMASQKWGEFSGLNLSEGGAGNIGMVMSDETKRKISIGNTGKKRTEESRKKLSQTKMGINTYWPSIETKEKMSKSRIGHFLSDDTKKKISETRKLRQIPSSRKGVKLSEEQKRLIGLSKIGNKNCLGKKHTPEHRRKISEKRHIKISVYNLDGSFLKHFESLIGASVELNVTEGTIWRSASGRTKNHKKYIFKYT